MAAVIAAAGRRSLVLQFGAAGAGLTGGIEWLTSAAESRSLASTAGCACVGGVSASLGSLKPLEEVRALIRAGGAGSDGAQALGRLGGRVGVRAAFVAFSLCGAAVAAVSARAGATAGTRSTMGGPVKGGGDRVHEARMCLSLALSSVLVVGVFTPLVLPPLALSGWLGGRLGALLVACAAPLLLY